MTAAYAALLAGSRCFAAAQVACMTAARLGGLCCPMVLRDAMKVRMLVAR